MRRLASLAAVLLLISLATMALSDASPVRAAGPPTAGSVVVVVDTVMVPKYDVYGSGQSPVIVIVNGTVHTASPTPMEIVSSFRPSDVAATAMANGTSTNLPVSVSPGRYGTSYSLDFVLPANITGFNVKISGYKTGYSFLWRYISDVPSVGLSLSALPGVSYSYFSHVVLPSGTIFSGTYYPNGTRITLPSMALTSTAGGSEDYLAQPYVGTVLLQSTWFVPGSVLVASVALIVFALASLNMLRFGKAWIRRISGATLSKLSRFGSGRGSSPVSRIRGLLVRFKGLFQPKRLLALFILCSVLMVGLGAVVGPYPVPKAYVLAAPGAVSQIHSSLASFEGNVAIITPSQDYSDFQVMSNIGDFDLAVVSNYPSLALPSISGFIVPGLANVPVIVMDNSTDPAFASQINALYGDRVIHVANAANLTSGDKQQIAEQLNQNARLRVLGLNLTVGGYQYILEAEGVLSFVLITVGWAFLGSLTSEARGRSSFTQLATIVSSGVFVFLFSEVIYVTTSILLAFPLSLHAVISGAQDVTAVGYIGFGSIHLGGGSTPRLAAGFIGVVLGLGLTEGAPKVEKTDLAIILGFILFILADPLYIGQFVYEGLLLFVGNFAFGSAFTSSLSLKGFIYGVGAVFGGSVNSTYLMSAGKMLYFAGLVPLAYLGKMGRTTTAIAVLLSALLIGDGGVRVGEMTPDKTVIAVIPGLFVGFAILIVILGLAAAEKYVRKGRN